MSKCKSKIQKLHLEKAFFFLFLFFSYHISVTRKCEREHVFYIIDGGTRLIVSQATLDTPLVIACVHAELLM